METVLAGGLWDAEIDRAQLESALVNLAINARDAMPDGGSLRIVPHRNHRRPVRRPIGIAAGDYVVIAVSDTGKGMPPAVLDKVFEPFFTTKEVGGKGLGLSMVYGFLQQSRGHIQIESEVDRGTTVRLYLPRSKEATEAAAAVRADRHAARQRRILVVEDDPRVRSGVEAQLKSLGYEVTGASDGTTGLAAFAARTCHSTCC